MIKSNLRILEKHFYEHNGKPPKVIQITKSSWKCYFYESLFTSSCLHEPALHVSNFPNTSKRTEWLKFPRHINFVLS